MTAAPPPIILTIGGFDPSAGAGVAADIKTIAAHSCYGVGCITALTVQSTSGVHGVEPARAGIVEDTLEELASDFDIAGVHIGMLATRELVATVADFLTRRRLPRVVLDPVLKSSSGAELLDPEGIVLLVERLFPLATVITPNVGEASVLTGLPVTNLGQMRMAADRLHAMGAEAIVVTGGHLDPAIDLLSIQGPGPLEEKVFQSSRLQSNSTHGTGCAFATAIACRLALGGELPEAVSLAKKYVTEAISSAYQVGRGMGPVHHLYGRDVELRKG